jgi:soluble lytic murein transglycosylase-like protein
MIWVLVAAGVLLLIFSASAQAAKTPAGETTVAQKYQFDWATDEAQVNTWAAHAAGASGVSAAKIKAIIFIESRGDPTRQNPSDPSYGLMALMIPTAAYYSGYPEIGSGDLLADAQLNADTGALFLAHLQKRYAAAYPFAIWAQVYNLGETKFDQGQRNPGYGARVLNTETGQQEFLNPGQLEAAFA